jgi:hypothetical protein
LRYEGQAERFAQLVDTFLLQVHEGTAGGIVNARSNWS